MKPICIDSFDGGVTWLYVGDAEGWMMFCKLVATTPQWQRYYRSASRIRRLVTTEAAREDYGCLVL
jgi:hypothetical protein